MAELDHDPPPQGLMGQAAVAGEGRLEGGRKGGREQLYFTPSAFLTELFLSFFQHT